MVVVLSLRLGLVNVEFYVIMQVSTYQVFSATLMVLLTSCLLNYMLFTRAFCLLKTLILLTSFATPIFALR